MSLSTDCPVKIFRLRSRVWDCGCKPLCSVCGFPPHSAVHMHKDGGSKADPAYDHEYIPMEKKA